MHEIFDARRKYGGVYATILPDGLTVPWHPLSMGDYLKFGQDYQRGIIPNSLIEDEIFRKCVTDKTIVSQMSFLKAGTITTVVSNIWQYSGPVGINEFNTDLEMARDILFNSETKAIHELVQMISMAFPYKPEEIYAMDYETFMFRLAQSEKKLIDLKIIEQPISMDSPERDKRVQKKVERPRIDAKQLYDEQEQSKVKKDSKVSHKSNQSVPGPSGNSSEKWWDISPVLEAKNKKGIKMNFGDEADMTADLTLDNDERASPREVREYITKKRVEGPRQKMLDDSRWIYADLIKKLGEQKKIK